MIMFQGILTWAEFYSLFGEEGITQSVINANKARIFSLFIAKFIMSTTIHLYIYPFFLCGLDCMKYIANHEDKFDYPVVGYILALLGLL